MKLTLHVLSSADSTLLKLPLWFVPFCALILLGVCRIVTGLFFSRPKSKMFRKLIHPFAVIGFQATQLWAATLQILVWFLMLWLGAPKDLWVSVAVWCLVSFGLFRIGTGRCRVGYHDSRLGDMYER